MDKSLVAQSFSRAATTYDQAAWFQRDVGERLLTLLAPYDKMVSVDVAVDLGCGTGAFLHSLQSHIKAENYIAVDIAEGMLRFAREQADFVDCLCCDAEQLPFASESVDFIFSNMALQWCENLPALFGEIYRVLKCGGQIALSSMGPNSLWELKQAWAQVDDEVHVNTFLPILEWQQAIEVAGFIVQSQRVENPTLQYRDVYTLLKELKQIGAHNMNEGRRSTLTGRRRLAKLYESYEAFFDGEYYPATYEMYYWVLQKPAKD